MDAVRPFDQVLGSWVSFWAQVDVEHRADFELLPAFAPGVDSPPVHTYPFALRVVTSWRRKHDPFHPHTFLLAVHIGLESCAIVLRLFPGTPRRNSSMPDALKHFSGLVVRQQTAHPDHLPGQSRAVRAPMQIAASVEGG